MPNLEIYNKVRTVPAEAQKPIAGGRLKGKTDINPMWRLKTLTELFGMCGVGWKYDITKQWLEQGADGQISAFVNINLYIKSEGEWSEAIPGTGGSMFVEKERNGMYTSDECFKMALTDAISVACKALGVGADVYWEKDASKYDKPPDGAPPKTIGKNEMLILKGSLTKTKTDEKKFLNYYKVSKPEQLTTEQYTHAMSVLKQKEDKPSE